MTTLATLQDNGVCLFLSLPGLITADQGSLVRSLPVTGSLRVIGWRNVVRNLSHVGSGPTVL